MDGAVGTFDTTSGEAAARLAARRPSAPSVGAGRAALVVEAADADTTSLSGG
jgi:hypothetical protein